MVEFRLTVDVRTALAVGAGPQARGGVTRAARDLDGYPMVPASTLKGALRATLERLLAGSNHPARATACQAVGGKGPCPTTAGGPCVLCLLFGGAGKSGVLRFSDAKITDETVRLHLNPARHGGLGTSLRSGIALDRASRAPGEREQAARETTTPFMNGFKLTARLEATRALSEDELTLLKAAARGVTALGGERSRGAGQARLELSGPMERSATAPRTAGRPGMRREKAAPAPGDAPAASEGPDDTSRCSETSNETATPAAPVDESNSVETTSGATPTAPRATAPADVFRVLLTAREPFRAAPATGRTSSFSRTSDRVPGSTLRGALAGELLARLAGGADHAVFRRAFLEGGLRVTDAIPAGRRVTPSTLLTCEVHPGFHLRSGARVPRSLASHGAWDTLLIDFLRARIAGARVGPATGRCLLNAENGSGPCSGTLVPLDSPYVSSRIADEQTAPFATVYSHRPVDRASGRGQRGRVHGQEATLPGKGISRYEGELAGVDTELAAELSKLSEVRVGGGTAAGRGLFQIALESGEPARVRAHLAALEEAVVRLLETWPGGAVTRSQVGLDRHRLAVLDLSSDWIPTHWEATLPETVVADLPKISGLEVLSARLTTGEAGGWNAAAGIPKTLRRTLARGGVVLISYSLAHESDVVDALESLAHRGIGRLTGEGYGQLRVSDPVHWERIPPLVEGR